MYATAKEAIFHSMQSGKPTTCAPTMENYTDLVEACEERRLQDDGSIVFRCFDAGQDWQVSMMRRPW